MIKLFFNPFTKPLFPGQINNFLITVIAFFRKIGYNIDVCGCTCLEVKGLIGGKIGLWEILVVLVVALVIFGPNKLPEMGRSIGNGLKEFRKATKDLKDSISLSDNETDKSS